MKINVLSDLHTEFWKGQQLVQPVENMVIAGDLCEMGHNDYDLKDEALIYIPGNHEYYGTILADTYVKPYTKIVEDVKFICATLWTDFQDDWFAEHNARKNVNDFHMIGAHGDTIYGRATVGTATYKKLHQQELDYIKHMLAEPFNGKTVVVTHFVPHESLCHERWAGNELNKYFAPNALAKIDVDHWPDLWIFGHTHDKIDKTIQGTRFVCNPFGYHPYDKENTWMEIEV